MVLLGRSGASGICRLAHASGGSNRRAAGRGDLMGAAIPSVNFGLSSDFSLGVEEELLLVDRATHALDHGAVEVLGRMSVAEGGGGVHPDYYAAMIELCSPICSDAAEAITFLNALRAGARAAGATGIGAGLHPTARSVTYVPGPSLPRDRRGNAGPASAHADLRVAGPRRHARRGVGHPRFNGLRATSRCCRRWRPTLRSGMAATRAWRPPGPRYSGRFPRSEIPPAFRVLRRVRRERRGARAAGGLRDYTFLWWDIRPHPALGTVEVRAMDSQSSLSSMAGLARWCRRWRGGR